jgi:hypothetical protein
VFVVEEWLLEHVHKRQAVVLAITRRVYNREICGTCEAKKVKEKVAKTEKERKKEASVMHVKRSYERSTKGRRGRA